VGISVPVLLLIVFMLGLIISTFSMLTGTLIGDIMSSTATAFLLWSISAMLSGILFPIDDSAAFLKSISYLMPQKWFMDVSERLLTGLSGTYPMLMCVTAAYLIVIISVGSVGLKIKKQEI
ncbi:MAG: ABC transporter permease, partial [Oscillospiraceae bacterium]|nr:ABC transporter permease [Oscillospiraceae bacterium]